MNIIPPVQLNLYITPSSSHQQPTTTTTTPHAAVNISSYGQPEASSPISSINDALENFWLAENVISKIGATYSRTHSSDTIGSTLTSTKQPSASYRNIEKLFITGISLLTTFLINTTFLALLKGLNRKR